MSDGPLMEMAALADEKIQQGYTAWQKWTCSHCGARQTMPDPNVFFTSGKCAECDKVTELDVCGFMLAGGDPEFIKLITKTIEES